MLGSRMSVVVELTATKPVRSDGADDSNNNGITHTKSPLNGVVDQLRTKAYPASKLRSVHYQLELAVWEAGVVMGRDTWNLNTSSMVYVLLVY
ncbi:hypothetical protein HanXRQr2_Chr16g0776951 [Helianthus annuus]|uniref:Uncharacterized protein n=1 Tax=Helianthus annuus TaxID=4232 RepID=A0A251S3N8_HELAN|nr:uncharacterized protein LOC110915503 isoform X2 [Helianthus annuus]KAF5762458.1 hypothetical protein HanXRQr2_Chr16g0776951 [Helianthus annuus]KAJ0823575.1 hypothetical protein HanPSC8_Chr16g0745321 [Helianthus annuus]